MRESTRDEAELAAWNTDVAPDEWVHGPEWSHSSPEFVEALAAARRRTEVAHVIATSGPAAVQ